MNTRTIHGTGRPLRQLRTTLSIVAIAVACTASAQSVHTEVTGQSAQVTNQNQLRKQIHSMQGVDVLTERQHELYNSMRKLWEDHVSWTRQYIVSAANNLDNKEATTARLLKNQEDIGNLIKPMYGESAGDQLTELLRTHILIATDIVTAAKNNNSQRLASKKQDWYENSDEIADFLTSANPNNWNRSEMRDMMREHLDLTLDEATAELNGNYTTGVRKYDQLRVQILEMADMLSAGIISQFQEMYPAAPPGWQYGDYNALTIERGTVIPFLLNQPLSSNESQPGDRFTARVDSGTSQDYQGLPRGAILEGHVDFTRPKSGTTPGVIGLAFDRVRMPDGNVFAINGSLIGLDSKSVINDNGRLVAKSGAKNDSLKYVGYGAGAGALVAIVTKGNIVSTSLLGAALGFLYGEIQKNPSKSRNVALATGTRFGVNLTSDFSFRAPARN